MTDKPRRLRTAERHIVNANAKKDKVSKSSFQVTRDGVL